MTMKAWVAVHESGTVLFAFYAENQQDARKVAAACRRRSDFATKTIRLLRVGDTGPCGAAIQWR